MRASAGSKTHKQRRGWEDAVPAVVFRLLGRKRQSFAGGMISFVWKIPCPLRRGEITARFAACTFRPGSRIDIPENDASITSIESAGGENPAIRAECERQDEIPMGGERQSKWESGNRVRNIPHGNVTEGTGR